MDKISTTNVLDLAKSNLSVETSSPNKKLRINLNLASELFSQQ